MGRIEPIYRRYEMLQSMNTIVYCMTNNERVHEHWHEYVPADANDGDMIRLAMDDNLFSEIIGRFGFLFSLACRDIIYDD